MSVDYYSDMKKVSTTTETRETNKLATFDTLPDGAGAAGMSAASEGVVVAILFTPGSGGSTMSLASNGGIGGSVGGLASGSTIFIIIPISGGSIIYGAVSGFS